MKKSTFALAILSIISAGFLFTSMAANKLTSVKGQINYYGNAPVETPAFKTDDGKVYLMEIDKSSRLMLEELLSHQGSHLELTGEIELEESKLAFPISQDGTIIISSYKITK